MYFHGEEVCIHQYSLTKKKKSELSAYPKSISLERKGELLFLSIIQKSEIAQQAPAFT
jgi:hypothetical protein